MIQMKALNPMNTMNTVTQLNSAGQITNNYGSLFAQKLRIPGYSQVRIPRYSRIPGYSQLRELGYSRIPGYSQFGF